MGKKSVSVMAGLAAVLSVSGCSSDLPPQDVCKDWEIDPENGGYVCDDDGDFIDVDGKKKKKKGLYFYGGQTYTGKSSAVSAGAFQRSSGFGSGSKGMG